MNELIFFIHIGALITLALLALKLGERTLTCFVILMTILSNLFVLKQIKLFSLTVTASDAYAICGLFSLNLIQEYFGKDKAKNVVVANFFLMAIFGLMSFIHLSYHPADQDSTQSAYSAILSLSPRIVSSSLLSYFFSQRFDLVFFGFLRKTYFKNSLSIASLISSSISQIIDTVLFSFLALYGQVDSIFSIIFLSLVIKFITILLMSPMMNFSKKIAGNLC